MASTQSLLVSSLKAGPGEWRRNGGCTGGDKETVALFYPEGDSDGFQVQIETAKRICAGCPMRERCLEHALAVNEQYGIWGGHTEKERKAMRRSLLKAARQLVDA